MHPLQIRDDSGFIFSTDPSRAIISLGDQPLAEIPLTGVQEYLAPFASAQAGECHWQALAGGLQCDRHLTLRPEQTVHLRDFFRWEGDGQLDWSRSWWHEGPALLDRLELFAAITPTGTMTSHLLPGILYDGNEGSVPQRLVPRLPPCGLSLFEEHKFPSPMVHGEFLPPAGEPFALTLESSPTPVADAHLPDQWWSLGLQTHGPEKPVTLLSVSGRLAFNGAAETIYDAQNHVSPYRDAWVAARPRHVYEKNYRLHLQTRISPRQSWRVVLRRRLASQPPLTPADRCHLEPPALAQALELKTRYALSRWVENDHCCGMNYFPQRPEFANSEAAIEYGWVGQNMRLGLSLWRWGARTNHPDLQARGLRIAQRWLDAALAATAAGRPAPTRYVLRTKTWVDSANGPGGFARSTAETLYELALFCRQLRAAAHERTDWQHGLLTLLHWYLDAPRLAADGLPPLQWDAQGRPLPDRPVTAGALFVAAAAEASLLPGGEPFYPHATALMQTYATRFLGSMPSHPCGSALDSGCEDMESGMFLLIAANTLARVQRARGESCTQTLQWANQAADWVLTWAYTWNVPLLPGTLLASLRYTSLGLSDVSVQNRCLHPFTPASPIGTLAGGLETFQTTGLSDVSVQNRHLHVFSPTSPIGALSPPMDHADSPLARLYAAQADRMLCPLVRTIARPGRRWGMDQDGEQTEQYNQTNYIQHPHDPVCTPRGGIARWFVPWMTVWVMSACLDALEPRR